MVRLFITLAAMVVVYALLSTVAFLGATAFIVWGHAVSWKLIALCVLGYVVWKRTK